MKIRAILAIAAVLVVVVLVASGVYGAYAIRSVNGLINTIYDNALMTSTFSQSARANWSKLDRATTEGAPRARLDALEREFLSDLDVVQDRALGVESPRLVAEIRSLYATWRRTQRDRTGTLPATEPDIASHIEERLTALTDGAAEAGYLLREASQNAGTQDPVGRVRNGDRRLRSLPRRGRDPRSSCPATRRRGSGQPR